MDKKTGCEAACRGQDIACRGQEVASRSLLTGLQYPHAFMDEARRFIQTAEPDAYCVVAIDMVYFRMFNKIHGRNVGDKLLRYIADCLETTRKQNGGVTGYFEGDNFCIVMPWKMELVEQLMDDIRAGIEVLGGMAGVVPQFGISPVDDLELPPELYYDRATLALSQATGRRQIVLYDPEMEERLESDMRMLAEINEGMNRDEFTFFLQPQCDISSGKVVGAESLVRWQHGEKGLIPPGKFIPLLERSGMIYLLDQRIWEKVCQWLRTWLDRGGHPIPISINISRIDVVSMDVPAFLSKLLKKYDLPAKYIKAEITESACTEEGSVVNRTVDRLREAGFLVMMDDFGSGYSSLNMLKSIAVDVLKIDMQFLDMEEMEEHKGVSILESIVNMARQMGLPIIVEGVETLKQENLLRSMGCRYTQGYYYCKPLPLTQFEEMLSDERRLDFSGLQIKQAESFHVRELLDGNLFTDTMINSVLGPSAIYDVYKNRLEIVRANEQFFSLSGMRVPDKSTLNRKLWDCVRDDDRPVILSLFEKAYESYPVNSEGYIHILRMDGKVLWVHARVFFLREKDKHRSFFISLSDITALEEKREERAWSETAAVTLGAQELEWMDQCYGSLPCGYGLFRFVLDKKQRIKDFEVLYANLQMDKMCGGDREHLRHLFKKAFKDDEKVLMQRAYQAAFLGDAFTHYAYSTVSNRFFQFTLYQHSYGCLACLMQDVTQIQMQQKAFDSLLHSYQEVYYLQLKENYSRKIFPEDDLIMDRGNYEAMIERHFGTGRILMHDEENVRRFLSLENLREVLKTEDSVYYRYRRCTPENPDEWCIATVTVSERKKGKPRTAVLTIRSIDREMRKEEEQRQKRMADTLASMSDGFFIYRAMEDENILYANPALMEIFGCESMEELMDLVGHSFQGIVHPDDLKRVEWEIEHQIQHSEDNLDYVQYRIIRKDGSIRWVDDWGHLENSKWGEEHRLFYVFVKDVTDTITPVQKEHLLRANQFHNEAS